jgi:hypothetical protein
MPVRIGTGGDLSEAEALFRVCLSQDSSSVSHIERCTLLWYMSEDIACASRGPEALFLATSSALHLISRPVDFAWSGLA